VLFNTNLKARSDAFVYSWIDTTRVNKHLKPELIFFQSIVAIWSISSPLCLFRTCAHAIRTLHALTRARAAYVRIWSRIEPRCRTTSDKQPAGQSPKFPAIAQPQLPAQMRSCTYALVAKHGHSRFTILGEPPLSRSGASSPPPPVPGAGRISRSRPEPNKSCLEPLPYRDKRSSFEPKGPGAMQKPARSLAARAVVWRGPAPAARRAARRAASGPIAGGRARPRRQAGR